MQRVLQDRTLSIAPGEVLGLVGESGSGKTSLAWAIMRHLPANARETTAGRLRLGDTDLRAASPKALETIRGRRMSMVFQDPSTALNPTLTIGRQVSEVLVRHRGLSEREAWREATEALEHVELRRARSADERYPHRHRRREAARGHRHGLRLPARADHVRRADDGARRHHRGANPGTVRPPARRPAWRRSTSRTTSRWSRGSPTGRHLERARSSRRRRATTISATAHDYTRRLVAAVPRPGAATGRRSVQRALLGAEDRRPLQRKRLFRPAPRPATANVAIDVRRGEILGIVGESGSGKSSIARALTGLADYSGTHRARPAGASARPETWTGLRRAVQIVFQHPDSSLNPRQTVADILARPLQALRRRRVGDPALLEEVRLPQSYARALSAPTLGRREAERGDCAGLRSQA